MVRWRLNGKGRRDCVWESKRRGEGKDLQPPLFFFLAVTFRTVLWANLPYSLTGTKVQPFKASILCINRHAHISRFRLSDNALYVVLNIESFWLCLLVNKHLRASKQLLLLSLPTVTSPWGTWRLQQWSRRNRRAYSGLMSVGLSSGGQSFFDVDQPPHITEGLSWEVCHVEWHSTTFPNIPQPNLFSLLDGSEQRVPEDRPERQLHCKQIHLFSVPCRQFDRSLGKLHLIYT